MIIEQPFTELDPREILKTIQLVEELIGKLYQAEEIISRINAVSLKVQHLTPVDGATQADEQPAAPC